MKQVKIIFDNGITETVSIKDNVSAYQYAYCRAGEINSCPRSISILNRKGAN